MKRKKSHNCSSRSHTPPPGRLPPLCSVFIPPGTLLLPRACNLSPDNQNLILNRSSRPQTCVESSPVIGTSSQARSMRDRPYIGAMEGQLSSPPKNSQDPAMIFLRANATDLICAQSPRRPKIQAYGPEAGQGVSRYLSRLPVPQLTFFPCSIRHRGPDWSEF